MPDLIAYADAARSVTAEQNVARVDLNQISSR